MCIRDRVERGSGDVQIAVLDNLRHITEEERHDQCVDVRTIDVGDVYKRQLCN